MVESMAMTDHRTRLGKGLTVRIAAWIFWSFVAAATAFAEEPSKKAIAARERSYYAYIENDIKQQFDTAMAEFKQTPKRDTSKRTQDDAIDGIKTMFYNKASIHATCAGEMLKIQSKTPAESLQTRFDSCLDAKLGEIVMLNKIISEYGKVFTLETAVRCEMEARLFERELLLPPYDFLKGGAAILIDAKVFNQCLRSKH
jgi:hypothetical protein